MAIFIKPLSNVSSDLLEMEKRRQAYGNAWDQRDYSHAEHHNNFQVMMIRDHEHRMLGSLVWQPMPDRMIVHKITIDETLHPELYEKAWHEVGKFLKDKCWLQSKLVELVIPEKDKKALKQLKKYAVGENEDGHKIIAWPGKILSDYTCQVTEKNYDAYHVCYGLEMEKNPELQNALMSKALNNSPILHAQKNSPEENSKDAFSTLAGKMRFMTLSLTEFTGLEWVLQKKTNESTSFIKVADDLDDVSHVHFHAATEMTPNQVRTLCEDIKSRYGVQVKHSPVEWSDEKAQAVEFDVPAFGHGPQEKTWVRKVHRRLPSSQSAISNATPEF